MRKLKYLLVLTACLTVGLSLAPTPASAQRAAENTYVAKDDYSNGGLWYSWYWYYWYFFL